MEFIKIDKSNSIPLYLQIVQSIRSAINDGTLQMDSKLPTEEELGQKFGLSRPVVRQAYKQLMEERLIYRQKGKGSFVLPKEEHVNLLKLLFPLTEKIKTNQISENIEELEHRLETYDPKSMPSIHLEKGENVYITKKMYFGERRTMFYMEIYQPEKYYPYEKENITIHRLVHVVKLSNDICKLFNIPNQSAGFKITSTSYNQENIIVDYSIAYVQGYNVSIILDYYKQ